MKNRLAKSIFIFLLPLIWTVSIAAQENCELTAKSAPLLLNLQTGMSPEQTQAAIGRDLKIKVKKTGERTFFQNYIKNPAPSSLNGVRALYLRFFDGKLYQAEIFYEPRPDLKTLDAITAALSSQLNFPAAAWQVKNNRAVAKCGMLSLLADNILNPRIEITDEIILAKIVEKREKKSGD